jgi:hypothetical protein
MALVTQEVIRRLAARPIRVAAAGLALACLLAGGCVTPGWFLHKHDEPPVGEVSQAVVYWSNQVAFAPDAVNGGVPVAVLRGRLYLFGNRIDFPRAGDGMATVELYDLTPGNARLFDAQGHQLPLEVWNIYPADLRANMSRDMIGWGYNLFLPWDTYRPDVCQVQLKVCYQPSSGLPVYANSSPMTLNSAADTQFASHTRTLGPATANRTAAPNGPPPVANGDGTSGIKPVSLALPARPAGQ